MPAGPPMAIEAGLVWMAVFAGTAMGVGLPQHGLAWAAVAIGWWLVVSVIVRLSLACVALTRGRRRPPDSS